MPGPVSLKMAPTKEDLGRLKASELQKELEVRGLDASGKKTDLVDRLWAAITEAVPVPPAEATVKVSQGELGVAAETGDPSHMLARLRIIKEKVQVEQDKLRLEARSEQLEIELQLAELGHLDEAVVEPLRVTPSSTNSSSTLEGVLSSQVKRTLLPPTELRPFTGEIEDFRLFMRAFEARIVSKTEDEGELLFYLEQFTRGKPNQLVRSCLHLGESGFQKAKELLETRYGDRIRLIDSYVGKVRTWARISPGDVEALDRFVLFLTEVKNAMAGSASGEFEHPSTLRQVVSKVPPYLQGRWRREADRLLQGGRTIRFADLVDFLAVEVRVMKSPLFGVRAVESGRSFEGAGPAPRHKVNAANVTIQGAVAQRCAFCGGAHSVEVCHALRRRPWAERRRFLLQSRLCFGCLRGGHRVQSCRRPLTCETCGGAHPSVMHREPDFAAGGVPVGSSFPGPPPTGQRAAQTSRGDWSRDRQRVSGPPSGGSGAAVNPPVWSTAAPPVSAMAAPPVGAVAAPPVSSAMAPPRGTGGAVVSASLGLQGVCRTALPVVAVRLRGPSGRVVVTNGFLDQGSSGSFLTDRLATVLGVKTERTSVSIETVGSGSRSMCTSLASGVQVSALTGAFHPLPPLLTINALPVTQEDRCRRSEVASAAHLQGIEIHEVDAPVEILIGSNCAELIVAREVRSPPEGQAGLCAVRTVLGWYVMGRVPDVTDAGERFTVNFLRVQEACPPEALHGPQGVQEKCPYQRMYERDFKDLSDDRECFSVEDREWIADVCSEIKRDEEGHFEIPLPKVDFQEIPESFDMAAKRLNSLRKRFKTDPEYFDAYRRVMVSLSDDGYAVPVSDDDMSGPVWYVPHHGVMEPKKGKLRVVFDCAAKSRGVCLNDLLKKGPNLSNSLLGVLCRFREGPVAFTCDVQSMYHRVHVTEPDTNLLRFLWFRDDDPDGELQVWKMRSHVFGAVSSGSVASLALRCCAEEGQFRYPEAADILLRKTYVDDALCSTDSVESAVQVARDLKELCKGGAFNMTKFTSNCPDFLKQIPVEDRGKNVKELDLDKDSLGPEHTLGLKWSVESDVFFFQFSDPGKPVTKRGILSTVSSVFDPLGIVSPVTLLGRLLLQKLCSLSCGWDDTFYFRYP